jgi:hypothetical protein
MPALAQQQQQTAPSQPVGGMPPPPEPSQNPETTTGQPATGVSPSGGPSSSAPSAPKTPQQSGTQAPVGTAAAPYEKGIGVAASRPAGAVIAPAKQRRTRSFWIKTGVLIGAAVAIGTVVGLSSTSPSRPN